MIFDLQLWTAYTGASLILENLVTKSSFYDIACFLIHASGSHLDATITSDNIFRNFSIDAIIFNCGLLIMDTSIVLEEFLGRSAIPPYNLRFKLSFIEVFVRMVLKQKSFRISNVKYWTFSEGPKGSDLFPLCSQKK